MARGQRHGSRQRPNSRSTHQHPQSARSAVQDSVRENRHQHHVRHAGQADHAQQKQQGANGRVAGRPVESLQNTAQSGALFVARARHYDHQQQPDDHRNVADPVGKKAPAFPDCRHRYSRHGRPQNARPVHHGGINSDGVDNILRVYHEASTMISHTLMWPKSVSAARTNASNMALV